MGCLGVEEEQYRHPEQVQARKQGVSPGLEVRKHDGVDQNSPTYANRQPVMPNPLP